MTTYTLHRLPDGGGYVISHESSTVTGGCGYFSRTEIEEALALIDAGEPAYLAEWSGVDITPEAAAYVAATYPTVANE